MAKLPRVKRLAALGCTISNRAARRPLLGVPAAPCGVPAAPLDALRNAASQRTAQ